MKSRFDMYEKRIVQIICDKEVGTAFYVAPDLLLTAWHTVESFKDCGNNVVKDVEGDLAFVVDKIFEEVDLAVLKIHGRVSEDYFSLLSHHIRIGDSYITYGYPDSAKQTGFRIDGYIKQRVMGLTADFNLQTDEARDGLDYSGMSGAPLFQGDKVVGVVIEQIGKSLNLVSIQKLNEIQEDGCLPIEMEQEVTSIPASIARDVEASQPNYEVIQTLDERLADGGGNWLLLYGSPGCGKTTLSACFESNNKNLGVLGRFFFKVPNDTCSRAERCSQGFFVNWLETVYADLTGEELVRSSFEDKRKRIADWLSMISRVLLSQGKRGVIFIDGLDELSTESGNRVDEFLSLIPDSLPDNISIVLSCITKEILPAGVIGRISADNYIEVTPLNMAACESFIQENSGEWSKPYSFIQAVAVKTEGHPLYMNYLCRYISETFNEATKECELNDWVISLPSIGGNIRSYYEAVWKKADPKGVVFEVLALLSQTRGPVEEDHLIGMMNSPNPFEFKSVTKEFRHLLKEKDAEEYEIYHSSFRLFIAEKLHSVIKYTNDQIATYYESHKDCIYAKENYLHHVVNGQNAPKGLALCNQEWADKCAILDISPDLVMHDIKECLSIAVDLGLPIEVIRLMLLAQRIENRCDSIMVDNVSGFVDLNIALGKPEVALKYIVRDNTLLVGLSEAIKYLRLLMEIGCKKQAFVLVDSIEAEIRKSLRDISNKGVCSYVFAAKGFLIVEGISAGVEDINDLNLYFGTLSRMGEFSDDNKEMIRLVINAIVAYQLSSRLRRGNKIDIKATLSNFKVGWDEKVVMLFVQVLTQYDEADSGLHHIGRNDAYWDCLRQLEAAMMGCPFEFSNDDLDSLLTALVDKPINPSIVNGLLAKHDTKTEIFTFRDENGVDIDMKSVADFYRESMYSAYANDTRQCPAIKNYYNSETAWERYIESLISRVAFIAGTLYRKRAASEDFMPVYSLVKETLDSINFAFDIRSKWKRSYLLPEDLLPFVYRKLAEFYCDFFEEKIDDFSKHLKSRMSDQLCLYREGYCATLIGLIGVFRSNAKMRNLALSLTNESVEYIMYAVQNRSERCAYLLQICLDYALLNEKEKAAATYLEVLDSSMGPEWYKEGQLGLINAINETDIHFDGKQVAHVAAIFEEASGEMTFQRYVQQSKNQFTGTIVKNASLVDAISYYKFETLPPVERIVNNAEGWKVDMPLLGYGYDLGANHLIESSAICYMLRQSKQVSPYIRYAVSELFWENRDKMHNDWNFAGLHSEIIDMLGEQMAREILIPRMAEYFVNEYYVDNKGDYLKDLEENNLPDVVLSGFQSSLQTNGFTWERKKKNSDKEDHRDRYLDKFEKVSSCKALLEELRKDIVSPLGSYWYSLDQFLVPLTKKPDFDKYRLLDVITSHFDVNVRPQKEQFEKFSWFIGKHDEKDADKQMICFLIWFLLHPESKIARRAEKSLMWLVNIDSRVIECLIEEIINPSEIGLATAASAALLEAAKDVPNKVLQYMDYGDTQSKLKRVTNFSVSRNLYEIACLLKDQCGDGALMNDMKAIIPDSMPDRGEVMLNGSDMMFIEHKIDKLNNLKVTGGKEFAKPFLEALKEMGGKDRLELLMKADKYAARSFFISDWNEGHYNRAMRDILDRVLYGKVDYVRSAHVYYTINS